MKALRADADIVRLSMPGRKTKRNTRPYYTFLGGDALKYLREYFERDRGWPKTGESVWIYASRNGRHRPVTGGGFSCMWLRLLRRAGLVPRKTAGLRSCVRYGFNVHNTRDLAISLLATISNLKPVCTEFWAGHTVDPLGYNQFYNVKPAWVEEQYRLAIPYLNIITQDPDRKHEITGGELVQAIQDHPEIIEQLAIMIKERSIR